MKNVSFCQRFKKQDEWVGDTLCIKNRGHTAESDRIKISGVTGEKNS